MKSEKGLYVKEVYELEQRTSYELPLLTLRIPAGLPYPGEDYIDGKLDLNEFIIKHPAATFLVRVEGDSMVDAGINSGDILVVDRALEFKDEDIVIALVEGELTVKRIRMKKKEVYLVPENSNYKPIKLTPLMNFEVRGVVTWIIRRAK